MPVIFFMLFGAIQIAAVYVARATALSAAQEAVATERMFEAQDGSGWKRADAFIKAAGDWLTQPTITVTETDTEVSCVVTGNALSVIPGWTLTVTQSASAPRERLTQPGGAG